MICSSHGTLFFVLLFKSNLYNFFYLSMIFFSTFPKGSSFSVRPNSSRFYCSTTKLSQKSYEQGIALCLRDRLQILSEVRPLVVHGSFKNQKNNKNYVVAVKFKDVPCNTGDPNWLEKTNTLNEHPKGLMFAVKACPENKKPFDIIWDVRKLNNIKKNEHNISTLSREGLRGKQKHL